MTTLSFPSNPTNGQLYDAPNGVQYTYDSVKWIVETPGSTSTSVTNSTQDRVAPMLVNGTHSGISFTYNDVSNVLSATVATAGIGTKGIVRVDGTTITINPLTGIISGANTYTLPTATTSVLGGVKVDGTTITINNGVISGANTYSLPTATTSVLGGVKVDGTTITINNGVISGANTYTLPTASSSVLGGVKVGNGLSINGSGVLSANSVTTGTTPPTSPVIGDLWYDTESGRTYIYYDSNWVDSSPVVAETLSLTTIKSIVADSTDFADFQTRIAAL